MTINKFAPQGKVKTIKSTIIAPELGGLRLVLNFANLSGKLESPLFPLFEKNWKKVKEEVRGWYATKTGAYKFGAILDTAVQSDVWVVNLLCQSQKDANSPFTTDLPGLELCLKNVLKLCKSEHASLHISKLLVDVVPELPRLIEEQIIANGVNVYYYSENS